MSTSPVLDARIRLSRGNFVLDAAFELGPGVTVLVGPNGAGKTSLLTALLGSLEAAETRILLHGETIADTSQRKVTPVEERRIGYVPQGYALLPHLSVRQNVAFALECRRSPGRREARETVDRALATFSLTGLATQRPSQLSGGEKQRVALARALVAEPRLLLLDEPLAALDRALRPKVRSALRESLARLEVPTLLVTHDPSDARELGERMIILEEGRIVQTGSFEELASAPASDFVAQFVSRPT